MWSTATIISAVTGVSYPQEAFWNPLTTDYRCFDDDISIIFTCSINVVSDITRPDVSCESCVEVAYAD